MYMAIINVYAPNNRVIILSKGKTDKTKEEIDECTVLFRKFNTS